MHDVHDTDEALLLSGDLEDFGRFYDRYVRSLLAFFQRRTCDPEVAADLTAETFAAAMVARGRYQARTSTAAAWLFAIAQHKLTDYRRRGSAEGSHALAARNGARRGQRRGRGDDPLARRRGRGRNGRGPSSRSARRDTCARARGSRLRRDRAQPAAERGGGPQARQPRAEGTARPRWGQQMSSDYIPRLRRELLR